MRRSRLIVRITGVVVAAWIAFEVIWSLTGEPTPWVDYLDHLAGLSSTHQPEGRNGWAELVEAGVTANGIQQRLREEWREIDPTYTTMHPDYSLLLNNQVDEAEVAWELRAIEEMRDAGVFDLLAEAAKCPRFVREVESEEPLYGVALPNLGRFRNLAKARVATMRLAFDRGDQEEAVRALEETLVLARASGGQPFIIDHLVAYAIQSLALTELGYCMAEHPPDEETGRGLLAAIERQGKLSPIEMCFEAELAAQLDLIQRTFTDDRHGDGRVRIDEALEYGSGFLGLNPMSMVTLASRREMTDFARTWADGAIANARQTPAERVTSPAFDEQAFLAGMTLQQSMLTVLISPMSNILSNRDKAKSTVASTRIIVALETYRGVHGTYPASLDDLVPDLLDRVPIDPQAGGPFGYRYPGGHETLPYMLYSTGADGVDDSTGPDESGDDFIFEPVRPMDDE
jgi:hypothetical protein